MNSKHLWVLGEALMDCVMQPDGRFIPLAGGSPYNMARAARLRGATVRYLNPLSTDRFGRTLAAQLRSDDVALDTPDSRAPTSLAMVQIENGHPSYSFYREGVADRDYTVDAMARAISASLMVSSRGVVYFTSKLALTPSKMVSAYLLMNRFMF